MIRRNPITPNKTVRKDRSKKAPFVNQILPFSNMSNRKAFTLVEMLVVIAIIAILVSLIMPAIMAARSSSQRVQCQSNLRQLGVAMNLYVERYNYYPQYRSEYPPTTNNYGVYRPRWQWEMASFLGGWAQNPDAIAAAGKNDPTYPTYEDIPLDNKVLICPSMDTTNSGPVVELIPNFLSIRSGSYGYNFGYLGNNRTLVDGDNTTPTLRYPVSRVKEPSRTIAFGDSRGGAIPHGGHSMTLDPPHMVVRLDNLTVNSPYWQQSPFNGSSIAGVNPYGPDEGTPDIIIPFSPARPRHGGRANVVFLDGHVESLSLQDLGYALDVSGNPILQTTATPAVGANGVKAYNALWTGRGLDEYSPGYNISSP